MSRKKRKVFGVISANSYDIEQREILSGAIEKAKSLNIGIAVISNIYNPTETVDVLKPENKIYDLILSDVFDGFILISESITNRDIQHQIEMNLLKKQNIPIVVIGTHFPDSLLPNSHFINTSDECAIEDICDHLIEVHHLDDIHILTGHDYIKTSLRRVYGYRNSLENHDVGYNKNKVFFGDFTANSGREQAQKYISGELPYPQALICCNDYMAFGLLDEFMEQNVKIPETMTIIGYEYIRERMNHKPLLTTYKRNSEALGTDAVRLLTEKLQTGKFGKFTPPKGRIIHGDTCGCGVKNEDIKREMTYVQTKATYDFLNLFSQLEYHLIKCGNISEFVSRCQDFRFIIHNVKSLYMCLYENWFNEAENSENMVCYNLIFPEKPLIFRKNEFSYIFHEEQFQQETSYTAIQNRNMDK